VSIKHANCTRFFSDCNAAACRHAAPDGGQWRATINLKREYNNQGLPLSEVPPEELFCTVTSRAHIALCITTAQTVLLNPEAVGQSAHSLLQYVPDGITASATPEEGESTLASHSCVFEKVGVELCPGCCAWAPSAQKCTALPEPPAPVVPTTPHLNLTGPAKGDFGLFFVCFALLLPTVFLFTHFDLPPLLLIYNPGTLK
jgi:hypothetical protein